jgi:hypothetical protein
MKKLTAKQWLKKFPTEESRTHSLLENIGCPKCGQREWFKMSFTGTCEVYDDSSIDIGDHEWNNKSSCSCRCGHHGTVGDFTFKGLDALIDQKHHE